MKRFALLSLLIGVVLAFSGMELSAQPDTGSCPALIERALASLADNCDALDRNSACYGYNQVDTSFTIEVEADFFTIPADRTELTTLQTIRTQALNLDTGIWGIAVMNVQANLPNTLPGQAVNFLLVGDAEIENRVPPEEALTPVEPVPVQVRVNVDVRTGPGLNTNVLGTASRGTDLEADALNGDWVRILFEDRPAWVERAALNDEPALDDLPAVTANTRTPMQAFYFSTGFGEPTCNEAPDSITVRSPEDLNVNFSVNGADVNIGSTIVFRNIAENQIIITVLEGALELPDGTIVEAGQTLVATLDDEGAIDTVDDIRPATPEELEENQRAGDILNTLFPPPEPPETGPTIHIVQPGETLFSIGRLYNASLPDIIAANNLSDPRSIFVGQQLIIPNPGSGFVNIPGAPIDSPPVDDQTDTTVTVSCEGFRATSPLNGLAYGDNTFYWDAAPGATSYRVTVFNNTEGGSVSFSTAGSETSLRGTLTQSNIGGGFSFGWQVEALSGDQVVCTSVRHDTRRSAAPPPPPPQQLLTASWTCTGEFEALMTFSGAGEGAPVTFSYDEVDDGDLIPGTPVTLTGPSGGWQFLFSASDEVDNGVVTSGGETVNLPGPLIC